MRKKLIENEAEKLINDFYQYMPFNDKKLGSCLENKRLIHEMEFLTAKQCALLCAKNVRAEILEYDDGGKWYWDEIIKHIESL